MSPTDNGQRTTDNDQRTTKGYNSPIMSLLMQRKSAAVPPRLEGKEVLVGPNPDLAFVKGVMFGGRKQFLVDNLEEKGFSDFVSKLSQRPATYTKTPLASTC